MHAGRVAPGSCNTCSEAPASERGVRGIAHFSLRKQIQTRDRMSSRLNLVDYESAGNACTQVEIGRKFCRWALSSDSCRPRFCWALDFLQPPSLV